MARDGRATKSRGVPGSIRRAPASRASHVVDRASWDPRIPRGKRPALAKHDTPGADGRAGARVPSLGDTTPARASSST